MFKEFSIEPLFLKESETGPTKKHLFWS